MEPSSQIVRAGAGALKCYSLAPIPGMVCAKASLSTQLLLPLAEAIYDSLEIGISAHSFGPNPATVYVDDVAISDKPID